ncbi:MAG: hypothetical protein KF878_04095 [Planctomycetes bacterium]|nr:hypothetical protein [Planctomycetota bacterium]
MSFVPDVSAHAGDAARVANDLRAALKELKVPFKEDGRRDLWVEYTPSPSYQAIAVRFFFHDRLGVCCAEGLLGEVAGEVHEELRMAINYLALELSTFRFYVGDLAQGRGRGIHVRHDLLPSTGGGPAIHPRELRQALTGLCAQKAVFADPLRRCQEGASWRNVKDALRALK